MNMRGVKKRGRLVSIFLSCLFCLTLLVPMKANAAGENELKEMIEGLDTLLERFGEFAPGDTAPDGLSDFLCGRSGALDSYYDEAWQAQKSEVSVPYEVFMAALRQTIANPSDMKDAADAGPNIIRYDAENDAMILSIGGYGFGEPDHIVYRKYTQNGNVYEVYGQWLRFLGSSDTEDMIDKTAGMTEGVDYVKEPFGEYYYYYTPEETAKLTLVEEDGFLKISGYQLAEEDGTDETPHEHIWSTKRAYDDTYCWLPCTVDGCTEVTNKMKHSLNIVIDKPATAGENGIAHRECFACDYVGEPFEIEFFDPEVLSYTKVWNGKGDIVIEVDSKKAAFIELLFEISKDEKTGLGTGVLKPVYDLDENGKGTITYPQSELEKLDKLCQNIGSSLEEMKNINLIVSFGTDAQYKNVEINIPIDLTAEKPTPEQPESTEKPGGTTDTNGTTEKPANDVPQTGDLNNIGFYMVLLVMSALCAAGLAVRKKKY